MEDWRVAVVVDVGRKMDFDDGMKNIEMLNRNSRADDQDLLEIVGNAFFIHHKLIVELKFNVKQTY
jgi:hypothetical protein